MALCYLPNCTMMACPLSPKSERLNILEKIMLESVKKLDFEGGCVQFFQGGASENLFGKWKIAQSQYKKQL